MNPLYTSEDLKDIQTQITKARQSLDLIYLDTENLRRTKASLEIEIENILKHNEYQNGLSNDKDTEIRRKMNDIETLNVQIDDKGRIVNELQGQFSQLTSQVEEKQAKLSLAEKAYEEHVKTMNSEREVIAKSHADAHEKHRTADEKLAKIKAFVNEL